MTEYPCISVVDPNSNPNEVKTSVMQIPIRAAAAAAAAAASEPVSIGYLLHGHPLRARSIAPVSVSNRTTPDAKVSNDVIRVFCGQSRLLRSRSLAAIPPSERCQIHRRLTVLVQAVRLLLSRAKLKPSIPHRRRQMQRRFTVAVLCGHPSLV